MPLVPRNPDGLCLCGCGQTTPLAAKHSTERGYRKGEPLRYVYGHHMRGKRAEQTSRWNGGRWVHKTGYVLRYAPEHPNCDQRGYVPEHRLVVEEQIGRLLTRREHVHHINGDKADNRLENLIALTHSEHLKLHGAAGLKRFYEEDPTRRKGVHAARRKNASS